MSVRRPASGFRHGLRVRVGSLTGPRGVLFRCESINRKTGEIEEFWRVRLQDVGPTKWVPPDDLIIDGRGTHVADACIECGLPYVTDDLIGSTYMCDRCEGEAFGQASPNFPRADDIQLPKSASRGPYQRRRR